MKHILRKLWNLRRILTIVLGPVLFLPLPLIMCQQNDEYCMEAKCGYAVIVVSLYWVTEVIPMGATAILPAALMPLLGIMKPTAIATNYFKDSTMMFMGGLIVAVAVEKWDVHKHIALKVLVLIGTNPRRLMIGFMLPTWFMSMWISNTASAAMMIPIVDAVLNEIRELSYGSPEQIEELTLMEENTKDDKETSSIIEKPPMKKNEFAPRNEEYTKVCKSLCLSIAYAAGIGGMATLTGTPPNIIMKGILDDVLQDYDTNISEKINFGSWMVFALPVSFISLILAWGCLYLLYYRKSPATTPDEDARIKEIVRKQHDALGPLTYPSKAVLAHFILLAILWVTRNPGFIPGWSDLFPKGFTTDSTPAVLIVISLFIIPSGNPCNMKGSCSALLDWKTVNQNLAWGVILLFGGGYAIAHSIKESGLSLLISEAFSSFSGMPSALLVFIIMLCTAMTTEVCSNSAMVTTLTPILVDLSKELKLNPLYLVVPATLSASMAFMLPTSAGRNAVVFAAGHLKVMDMVRAGVFMNVICLGVSMLALHTWGMALLDLGEVPNLRNASLAFNSSAFTNMTVLPSEMSPTTLR